MEKTVVRRGIGAVVLALVAALLLGYLLKGKSTDREKVVNMELPKSPIQIFPDGEAGADGNPVAGTNADGSVAGNTAGAGGETNGQGNANALTATGAAVAAGGAAVIAKTGSAAGNVAGAVNETAKAGVNAGNAVVANGAKNKVVDEKTGNPSLNKGKVVVDGSGQAVFGANSPGAKNSPAKIDFRTTANKEVRPSVDGKATIKKKQVASKPRNKSNARLVGEKKLPPVGRGNVAKKSSRSKDRKVASSKGSSKGSSKNSRKASSSKSSNKVASSSKSSRNTTVAKKTAKPVGRNKYVVQLLATSNASKANSLKATMKREGYAAYVAKAGSLYRVRVGTYKGKAEALKVQSRMKRRYRKNSYVQSSIVVKN